jgi:hypothetical protein
MNILTRKTAPLIALTLFAMAMPALAIEVPTSKFDIKGVKLGDSIELKDTQFPGITCKTLAPGAEECSNPDTTLMGFKSGLTVHYLDGRIVSIEYINIDPRNRKQIDNALEHKFGTGFYNSIQEIQFWDDVKDQAKVQLRTGYDKEGLLYLALKNTKFFREEFVSKRIELVNNPIKDL